MGDREELTQMEWFDKTSWRNRAFLRKLEGCAAREVDLEVVRRYVGSVVSPQLAIAAHLDDELAIRTVCIQILSIMRFLPKKERSHKIEVMKAALGFDYDVTRDFKEIGDTYAKFQKKVDFRKRWLWFLPMLCSSSETIFAFNKE